MLGRFKSNLKARLLQLLALLPALICRAWHACTTSSGLPALNLRLHICHCCLPA